MQKKLIQLKPLILGKGYRENSIIAYNLYTDF